MNLVPSFLRPKTSGPVPPKEQRSLDQAKRELDAAAAAYHATPSDETLNAKLAAEAFYTAARDLASKAATLGAERAEHSHRVAEYRTRQDAQERIDMAAATRPPTLAADDVLEEMARSGASIALAAAAFHVGAEREARSDEQEALDAITVLDTPEARAAHARTFGLANVPATLMHSAEACALRKAIRDRGAERRAVATAAMHRAFHAAVDAADLAPEVRQAVVAMLAELGRTEAGHRNPILAGPLEDATDAERLRARRAAKH